MKFLAAGNIPIDATLTETAEQGVIWAEALFLILARPTPGHFFRTFILFE
jgi:hypothetical protein